VFGDELLHPRFVEADPDRGRFLLVADDFGQASLGRR
jgi:hypothetical protein